MEIEQTTKYIVICPNGEPTVVAVSDTERNGDKVNVRTPFGSFNLPENQVYNTELDAYKRLTEIVSQKMKSYKDMLNANSLKEADLDNLQLYEMIAENNNENTERFTYYVLAGSITEAVEKLSEEVSYDVLRSVNLLEMIT